MDDLDPHTRAMITAFQLIDYMQRSPHESFGNQVCHFYKTLAAEFLAAIQLDRESTGRVPAQPRHAGWGTPKPSIN